MRKWLQHACGMINAMYVCVCILQKCLEKVSWRRWDLSLSPYLHDGEKEKMFLPEETHEQRLADFLL